MLPVKNIVFDFDGTLVDTAPLIIATMQASMRELDLPAVNDDECRATIGLRLEDVPGMLWPEYQDIGELYAGTYRRIFDRMKATVDVRCYPHVADTLKRMHSAGYNLAIASSRNHKSLEDYVAEFDIAHLFLALVGGDDVRTGKPAPDAVMAICSSLHWNPSDTLVVGDAVFDIEMGHNAGTRTCAVSYGNQSREQLSAAGPDMIIDSFAALYPLVAGVGDAVVDYVESCIIPRYASFDKAHRENHVRMVIEQSMMLADRMPHLNRDMVYIVAAFHDLGLVNGRDRHHIDSGRILAADPFVSSAFSSGQIETMVQAVEDHRASNRSKPRSEYGLVVAEADRFIDADTIMRRALQYGLANYPDLDMEGQFQRTLHHLQEKYGPDGYLKIWIPWSENAERLRQLHDIIGDTQRLREVFMRIYREETL